MRVLVLIMFVAMVSVSVASAQDGEKISAKSNSVNVDFSGAGSVELIPALTWISIPNTSITTVKEKTHNLKVGVKSKSEITHYTIMVDGEDISGTRGLGMASAAGPDDYDLIIDRELTLENHTTHEIRVLVENEDGEATLEFRYLKVDAPVELAAGRKDYALIFATNEYDEWDDLTNPVFDGTTIANELEESYGYEVDLVLNPTTSDILTKIREYGSKNYMPNDQLFIFFAGHGQFDEVFTEGYVVAKNSKMVDAAKETYISHSSLRTYISNIPSNHIFLAMDVCFGGTFDQSIAQGGHRGADMYGELDASEYIERKLRFKTRKYLTSGGKQYVPDGRPGEHSPFARKFIDALRSYGGRDKILTLGEITGYVEKINPEPKFGDFPGDEPGSDFIFVAK